MTSTIARSQTPHYVRVARALALVTGLAGVAACGTSNTPAETDSGASGSDSGMVAMDSGPDMGDAGGGGDDAGSTGDDGGGTGDDGGSAMADAGTPTDGSQPEDAAYTCETCVCTGLIPEDVGPAVTCESVGRFDCCAVIGPLFPPDLPA